MQAFAHVRNQPACGAGTPGKREPSRAKAAGGEEPRQKFPGRETLGGLPLKRLARSAAYL